MPQRETVLEHGFVRLQRAGALPPCLEATPQHVALRLGAVQALVKNVALPTTLFEFGTETPTAG
jgi:hypothetical protein